MSTSTEEPHGETHDVFHAQSCEQVDHSGAHGGRWLAFGLMLGIVAVIPALLGHAPALKARFDGKALREYQDHAPEVVFIGDSMLGTRVDAATFARESGLKVQVLAEYGSGSASWYLLLKNIVASARPAARVAFIFFRDDQLSRPLFRTAGSFRRQLERRMDDAGEPVLTRVLENNRGREESWLTRAVQRIYPLQSRNAQAQARLDDMAIDQLPGAHDRDALRDEARDIFALKNLRFDLGVDLMPMERLGGDSVVFDPGRESTFLPHLVEVAQQSKIHLCFLRVKNRPGSPTDSENLARNLRELKAWLEQQGQTLIDESNDDALNLDMYADGDHLKKEAMPEYTRHFVEKYKPLLTLPR